MSKNKKFSIFAGGVGAAFIFAERFSSILWDENLRLAIPLYLCLTFVFYLFISLKTTFTKVNKSLLNSRHCSTLNTFVVAMAYINFFTLAPIYAAAILLEKATLLTYISLGVYGFYFYMLTKVIGIIKEENSQESDS